MLCRQGSPHGPPQQSRFAVATNLPTCLKVFSSLEACICLSYSIVIGSRIAAVGIRLHIYDRMAIASDYRVDGMPRVRVLCASTGELIYEPTHPWLEQVRCHLLKKWTWINKGEFLPTASTMFHLHFEVDRQPVDDFQCLGALTLGRPLLIHCSVRAPQRPDIRHRKCMVDAIEQGHGQRLWSLLSNYYPPLFLSDRQGNPVNPLLLALQAGDGGAGRTADGFSLLSILIAARCDPNTLGEARLSPLHYAIGLQDREAVEDLLIARAQVNSTLAGLEPPLCVAVRHRMGDIARILLTYHADVDARCQADDSTSPLGPSATELAANDPALDHLLRAHSSWIVRIQDIEEVD